MNHIPRLEVLLAPAEFEHLGPRDLSQTVCVVFDVLRATTSIITALANGASRVIPVQDIPEALERAEAFPEALLAGERHGVRISAAVSGGVEFHLGNSPREFTRDRVAGRTIITTTTNGTRALRSCREAKLVLPACFLNLRATVERIRQLPPGDLMVICSGTFEEAAYEDILAAGALCDGLWDRFSGGRVADSALAARLLYQEARVDLPRALARARNGARLLEQPDLRDDVAFCAQLDLVPFTTTMTPEGIITAG
jgi:2-phosphosulfolactate phosphatase